MIVYHYPKCSTCKKALKWLTDHGYAYEAYDIVEETPTKEQLEKWLSASERPIRSFFNTSGMKYRELGLKDKMDGMTVQEAATWLSEDGMLIKRPLIIDEQTVYSGFKTTYFES